MTILGRGGLKGLAGVCRMSAGSFRSACRSAAFLRTRGYRVTGEPVFRSRYVRDGLKGRCLRRGKLGLVSCLALPPAVDSARGREMAVAIQPVTALARVSLPRLDTALIRGIRPRASVRPDWGWRAFLAEIVAVVTEEVRTVNRYQRAVAGAAAESDEPPRHEEDDLMRRIPVPHSQRMFGRGVRGAERIGARPE